MVQSKATPFYDWDMLIYKEFMMTILNLLEPRLRSKESIVYQTVEDVEEMYFIMKGSVNIGFEFNRNIINVVRLRQGCAIGAYNCTFDKKTIFNYSVNSRLEAFIIRKREWYHLMNDCYFKEIVQPMRKNIENNYMTVIKDPIIRFQHKYLNR